MSKNELLKSYTSKIGEKNGIRRVWITSNKIHETELIEHLRYEPEYDFINKRIILRAGFSHKITLRNTNNMPVIDILNKNINEIFDGFYHVVIKLFNDEIIIEPLREEIEQNKAKEKAYSSFPTAIEIFAGGGTLIKALNDAGIKTIAAVELEDKYLQNLEANNPNIVTHCGDLAKLDVNILPKNADIVVAGAPCEGFSIANTKSEKFENHPTGSLGFFVLKIIDVVRPAVAIIEEVPNFRTSSMAALIRYVLTSFGYEISETILHANEYGSLTKRKRYCMVASMKKGFQFDDSLKKPNTKTVLDILEIPIEDREWLTRENSKSIAYSLLKEQEHIRKGDGFRIARTYIEDSLVATVTKGYYLNRITDPLLINPHNSDMFSWFTPRELARINGLPDNFKLTPSAKSTCGEIIGQGVSYDAFYAVGQMVINHFNDVEIDREQEALEDFKSKITSTSTSAYDDCTLKSFMNGSLF